MVFIFAIVGESLEIYGRGSPLARLCNFLTNYWMVDKYYDIRGLGEVVIVQAFVTFTLVSFGARVYDEIRGIKTSQESFSGFGPAQWRSTTLAR